LRSDHQTIQSRRVVLERDGRLEIAAARITIQGGRITAVERLQASSEAAPDGCIDLGDRLLSPAFINAHTHLSMVMFRGLSQPEQLQTNVVENLYFEVEKHLVDEDIYAFTRMGAYESLLAGVGCVWDHYYGKQVVVDALLDTGLSAVFAPTLQDQGGPAAERSEDVLDFTLALHADARAAEGGVVAALGPHATDTVSPALWSRVAELSQTYELPIHVHVAQSVEELNRSQAQLGCTPIGKLQQSGVLDATPAMLLVHGLFVSHPDLELLDPARHVLGYCPFSQVQFDYPAQIDSWRQAGLRFALGTDCGACNDSMSVQQELRLVAGGHAFETTYGAEHDAFRLTGGSAEAAVVCEARRRRFARNLELNDPDVLLQSVWQVPGGLHPRLPLGRIEVGCVANLAVWDLQHPAFWPGSDPLRALAFGDVGGALDGLMVNGCFVGELGNHARSILHSSAYQDARREADARLQSLLQKIGAT
jgi:5-methylthioadenosine/S-adenosylhomocysteine deaminase